MFNIAVHNKIMTLKCLKVNTRALPLPALLFLLFSKQVAIATVVPC